MAYFEGAYIYGNSALIVNNIPIIDYGQNLDTINTTKIYIRSQAVISVFPSAIRNPGLDTYYYFSDSNIPGVAIGSYGIFLDYYLISLTRLAVNSYSIFSISSYRISGYTGVAIRSISTFSLMEDNKNFILWSNIGDLNFEINRSNVAGKRPLDWKGHVWEIKKLGNKIISYGENGISILTPIKTAFGLETISKIGIKGMGAITGDESIHLFVDALGRLWSLSEELNLLDYSEFLSDLNSNIKMSYDNVNALVYICDGVLGYVYSIKDKSLGSCANNITGFGFQDGNYYIVASEIIENPLIVYCSIPYDFESRKQKTLHNLEFGVDGTDDIYASIEFKIDKNLDFISLPWFKINPSGIANINCYGIEFRIKFKSLIAQEINIEYIKINGIIHNYSYLDSLSLR